MIRSPLPTLESLRDTIMDITRFIKDLPIVAVMDLTVIAVASTSVVAFVSSRKIKNLWGIVQIGGTTVDVPEIEYYSTDAMKVTYDFDASTTGKQTYRFLMVGR
jgi:hypothetical protein